MRFIVALALIVCPCWAEMTPPQRQALTRILGPGGTYTAPEDTMRFSFPRRDVTVTVDGAALHPFAGLTSWTAFTGIHYTDIAATPPQTAAGVMMMGDLVLFEDEVNPVMSAAFAAGLEVTALHNHFFFDQPRVLFMHIGGSGNEEQIARGVKKCLDQVAAVRAAAPQPAKAFPGPAFASAQPSSIDKAALDKIFETDGQANAGMYKATFGRKVKMQGHTAGSQMGVNTWAAFSGSMEKAFVDGDFACHPAELQTVLQALRKHDVYVVAIHNHMTEEEPRLVFLHYWAKGRAVALARALRATLDEQARFFPMTNK